MQRELVDTLRRLNNTFYERQAQSFSATRQKPWNGWGRVIESLKDAPLCTVVDVGCGNMRFKTALEDEFHHDSFTYYGIDSCKELAACGSGRFVYLDIIESLLNDSLSRKLGELRPDLCVAFGVLHHIPGKELRERFARSLVRATVPDGIVALSFWRFAEDEKLRDKAARTTERGLKELGFELEYGDYLLGWADEAETYRYCHSFTWTEIDSITSHLSPEASVVDRFEADGRNGAMNGYVVFRRR